MDVRLLGPVEVEHEGRAIGGIRPKTRAVLALLALDPGRLHSTDSLIEGLWADDPPPSAATSLRSHISRLRAALPDGSIETVGNAYKLNLAGGHVDLERFSSARADADAARRQGRTDVAEKLLTEALAWWRGDAVPELGDTPRAVAVRRRLDEHRASLVEAHAAVLGELGRAVEGIAALEVHCERAPYREEAWALLMRLLARAGRQADALATYQRARDRLVDDLGIEPGTALRAVEADILANGTDVSIFDEDGDGPGVEGRRDAPAMSSDPSARNERAAPPGGRTGRHAFVGREHETSTIVDACNASGELLTVVLVDGPPGIGKSRLVDAARRLVTDGGNEDRRWLVGNCEEGLELAYQPLVTALRSGPTDEVAAAIDSLPAPLRASIGRVLPEAVPPDALADGLPSRDALFEALRQVFDHVGRGTTLVLVLEDMHWSSTDTTDAVRYLLSTPPPSGLRLVLTFRGGELGDDHPFHDVLDAAHRRGAVDLVLGPLETADVERLVRTALPDAPDDAVEVIVDRADGSPLFATELVKDAMTDGSPSDGAPSGIVGIVEQRLRRLAPVAKKLVQAGSLIGQSFTLDVVAAVEDVSEDQALDALEMAVHRGLIEETEFPGRFSFAHALVQSAVAGTLGGPTRQGRTMWRIGEAAEGAHLLDGRARRELTARALCAGAETGDPRRAVDAALRAGDAAYASFDAAAAIAMYDLAGEVLDRCGARFDDPERATHQTELGKSAAHLLYGAAGLHDAVAASRRALRAVAGSGDEELIVACVEVVGRARAMQHTPLETVDLCREASDALAGASDASRAVVLAAWAAAHCATYTGQLADVVRLFRDAIAIAEGVDDADVRRTVFGYAYESGVAEYPGLVASHLRAEYVAACSRSSSPVVQAWGELASCAEPPDPAEDPTDAYRRGLEKVDRVGDTAARTFQVDLLAHTEYTRAGLMLRAGDLDALNDRLFPSEASPEPVERLARRFGLTAHRIGELLYHRDELRLVVASTRELANEAPTRTMLLNWYGGHALGLADSGDADAATEVLDDISADELVDLAVGGTTVFAWLIEAAWSVGHRATLEGCLPRFDGAGAAEAGVALHGTPGMWRALAHWGLGRIDAADEQFEVGRAHCDELGLVLFANIADAYRARLWFEHDLAPIDDVIALADRARRSAREHGQHRVTRILAEVPSADGS